MSELKGGFLANFDLNKNLAEAREEKHPQGSVKTGIHPIVSTEHDRVVKAVETVKFKDFEDCLQDKCPSNQP